MTRYIDADALVQMIMHTPQGVFHIIHCMPTVDAIPIEFIEKRIAELKKLNDYEFVENGGYTSPSDYEQWELERLIRDWREQNDEIH